MSEVPLWGVSWKDKASVGRKARGAYFSRARYPWQWVSFKVCSELKVEGWGLRVEG